MTREQIQAHIQLILTSTDEQIAAMYEEPVENALDRRENECQNMQAEIEKLGLEESSFQWNF